MGMLVGCGSNSNSGSANTGSNAGSNAADSSDASESTAAGTESTGNIDTADLAGTQRRKHTLSVIMPVFR